ncbi:glucosidase [Methylobacterium sp. WL30]|uniref:MGH1-like glycoside hydrolase domain-containing protein n=1 Tax=unclassified Methylobacterium TaxID=2615210 RepID=UPI0011C92E9C|nr:MULTISPECIES: glucosidase [unclassified Methylobacterium]TXN39136.1 glucosidase [Methylobacterium sp. WL93]TXN53201.1 glucosidase [Methylobacterium sp. WL119]TXN69235.1 glucosidase [Methylobacterium sp. WL30]
MSHTHRPPRIFETVEGGRLAETRTDPAWRLWGPYLSDRQWGTVREDYSADGEAWDYLPHDHARSRAYRWGEDGIGGFADKDLNWCLSLALWNGCDPILKERLFGLTNAEGNHGEDVKELYYYLDGVPTHAYMRMLYKYPHDAFPYSRLTEENARCGLDDREFELIDTGLFDAGRYCDVTIEYAKAGPDDVLMRVTAINRGPDEATLALLPQLFSRNTWSWANGPRPDLRLAADGTVLAVHHAMPAMRLHADGAPEWLFCENETNAHRLFGAPQSGYPKDGIGRRVVDGEMDAVNPDRSGTKCAGVHRLTIAPGGEQSVRLRFRIAEASGDAFADFDAVFSARIAEADAFYAALQADIADADRRAVQRQALAGMLWSKQLYHYDVREWLDGDPAQPAPPEARKAGRNADWRHVRAHDIISMPDAWEYPWFASWDLALQSLVFATIDPDFAKGQILLLLDDAYGHPNAEVPAYEWNFSDANPPLHAFAAWRVFSLDQALTGRPDHDFLLRVFNKLTMNFTWWVNRKDASGRNLFQGGFLGLDNIGLFDRSKPIAGGALTQSDATAWMAMNALELMRIAVELALRDPAYEDMAEKFFEHFLLIADAAARRGGLWDETDQFFYDVIETPGGERIPIRARTLVGLIPICAVAVLRETDLVKLPGLQKRLRFFLENRPDLASLVSRWQEPGEGGTALLSLLRGHRLKALLRRMLDEGEFLSPHGIRGVSKVYERTPFHFAWDGADLTLPYEPAESRTRLFGGNSNWRGPIWLPINYLLIDSLRRFHRYYGPDFRVEAPTGSGTFLSLQEIADELANRMIALSTRGPDGTRPFQATSRLEQEDPHFRDHVLCYEYYHGDTGRGLGASHQTGWSGLVALLIQQCALGPIHALSPSGAL